MENDMSISKDQFSKYIKSFQLQELFNDMGWNNDRTKQVIKIDNEVFIINGIAEKSGFKILKCTTENGKSIPDYNARKKVEGKITKLFQEHLIIYFDDNKKEQVWQLAVRKSGSPVKITETRYNINQNPELLYQRTRGLFFSLDEEDKITIVDVTKRVSENFNQNNERVTKKFYENFKKQHTAFLGFIKGIEDKLNHEWYASLMLNRLMFCYFIQKKGFLDNNRNYLRDKLNACREKKGKNKFYSFYRDFLLVLFHEGLGAPEHGKNLEVEIGKIPYLNGGLFDEHEIEKMYKNIKIDDEAFVKIFDFFDQYEWHLDTRADANGMEINPDVIGYIFEKYINDRAQMGAYYTKEDITDYIAKNCIIPYLFDEVGRNYKNLFVKNQIIWKMIKESGDSYIYDAVKYGVPETDDIYSDLPDDIQKGFNAELASKVVDGTGPYLYELRKDWNKQAPEEIALPTEIYREVIERRKRYIELKDLISSGKIESINDFITYNLNIRQFVQDVVETIDDPDFIKEFYKALSTVTILDPTCGSGAFLFAAMNILEPLYVASIQRMESYIIEGGKGKYKFFEKVLETIKSPQHPNLEYFIYKSIILNNLYGVDIMKEAVEIAKLRLFLKLVATVDVDYRKPNMGLEPLPDVDFNIRSGNTLIGYATKVEIDSIAGLLVSKEHKKKILEKCDIVARAFARYKEIQLSNGSDYNSFKESKDELNEILKKLTDDLDSILFQEKYQNRFNEEDYEEWFLTHKPFHWFAEFYEIINSRYGFDVIIGNPPYVEYSKVKKYYTIIDFDTESCGNLYAFVMEKTVKICHDDSFVSFVVPLAGVSTERMLPLQKILLENNQYLISIFIESTSNPSLLFNGVKVQLVIHNYKKGNNKNFKNYTTNYLRFYSSERTVLFDKLTLTTLSFNSLNKRIPKFSNSIELSLLEKINNKKSNLSSYFGTTRDKKIYYRRLGNFFFKLAFLKPPLYKVNQNNQLSSTVEIAFIKEIPAEIIVGIINSTITYWFWVVFSNVMDFKLELVSLLKYDFGSLDIELNRLIGEISKTLLSDLDNHKLIGIENRKNGDIVEVARYFPQKSKDILDQIDCLLAIHYGFTNEELDFIINYDIKYRMGRDLDSEESD